MKSQVLIIAVIVFFAASCNTDHSPDNLIQTIEYSTELLNFKGLTVNHNTKTPISALEYTEKDFQQLLLENLSSNTENKKVFTELVYPTLEELAMIATEIESNYPSVYHPTPEDADSIRNDFPGLNDEQIEANLEIIDEYYEQNMKYDIIQVLSSNNGGNINNRILDYPGGLCSKEFWVVMGRPRAIDSVKDAKENAENATQQLYPSVSHFQTRADAFRHAFWSVLIAKYYGTKKDDLQKGLQLAEEFTDAHEECNKESSSWLDYDSEMDYHNNWVGRVRFNLTARYEVIGSWPFKRTVLYANTDLEYQNDIKARANSALKAAKSMAGIDAVRGDNLIYFTEF